MKGCRIAILIVNGYDRYNRWGPHTIHQAKAHPWIELCLRQIQRHTDKDTYQIFIYDNAGIARHRWMMRRYRHVSISPPEWRFWISKVVPAVINTSFDITPALALDFLTDRVISDFDYFITMDSDAFPIKTGWIDSLIESLESGAAIVGVYRDEMREVIPPFIHISCLCMRTSVFANLGINFGSGIVKDIGLNITLALRQQGRVLAALPRSNQSNRHFLIGGIYGNLIYHHGAGSRRAQFWTSTDVDRDEEIRIELQKQVFTDLDSVLRELTGVGNTEALMPIVRYLAPPYEMAPGELERWTRQLAATKDPRPSMKEQEM